MDYRKPLLALLVVSLVLTNLLIGGTTAQNMRPAPTAGQRQTTTSEGEVSAMTPRSGSGVKDKAPVPPKPQAEAEFNLANPTGWGWFYHQTKSDIEATAKKYGVRPINLIPNGLAEHNPRFHVLYVINEGVYKVNEWIVVTREGTKAKDVETPIFRSSYWRVTNAVWHLYKNGAHYDLPEWRLTVIQIRDSLYYDYDVRVDLSKQELLALGDANYRVVDLNAYENSEGIRRYAAVFVLNTGSHYKHWGWLFALSRSEILKKAQDINGKPFRVTDIERRGDGKYDVLITENTGLMTKWYVNLTPADIKFDVLRRHGSWYNDSLHGGIRFTDLVAYQDGNTTKYEVLTMENGVGEYPIARDNVNGFESFDAAFIKTMSRNGAPGASFALSKNGKVIYRAAYGYADLKNATPATQNNRGRIASISKPITAAAIMKLIQQGKLSLDDQVFGKDGILSAIKPYDYKGYKGFDVANLEAITVRHLLTHTAGWDRGTSGDPSVEKDTDPYTCNGNLECEPTINKVQQIAQHAKNQGILDKDATRGANAEEIIRWMIKPDDKDFLPTAAPGAQQVYSNFGYTVLQKILEVKTGKTYEAVIYEMANAMGVTFAAGSSNPGAPVANEWTYHDEPGSPETTSVAWSSKLLPDPVPNAYWVDMNSMRGHGGWVSTPADLLKFVSKLDSTAANPWIAPAYFTMMMERPAAIPKDVYKYIGLCWSVDELGKDTDGKFIFEHGGRLYGSSSLTLKGWSYRKVAMSFLFNSTADASGGEVKKVIEPLIAARDDEGILAGLAK